MTKKEFNKKCTKMIRSIVGSSDAPTLDDAAFELDVHLSVLRDVLAERRAVTLPMIVNYHWLTEEPYDCMGLFDEPVLDGISEEEWRSMPNEVEEYNKRVEAFEHGEYDDSICK